MIKKTQIDTDLILIAVLALVVLFFIKDVSN